MIKNANDAEIHSYFLNYQRDDRENEWWEHRLTDLLGIRFVCLMIFLYDYLWKFFPRQIIVKVSMRVPRRTETS